MTETVALNPHEMKALLSWYVHAGIDVCVGDAPVDQMGRNPKPNTLQHASIARPDPGNPAQIAAQDSPPAAMTQNPVELGQGDPKKAAQQASIATSLEEVRQCLEELEGCGLSARATKLVFGSGDPNANVMFVGKAPGRDDDLQGEPFVGVVGDLLNNMLKAIGLTRDTVYLSNIVPWRPPGNRDPAPQEIAMCVPFLNRQIEIIKPKIIVVLGEIATKTMLGEQMSLMKLRGQWQTLQIGDHSCEVLSTLHPDFLLRQPAQKRQSWLDLQALKRAMDNF